MSTHPQVHTENESKTKQRYWVTFLLEDLPLGAKFSPGLLHITVVPWFVSDLQHTEIIKSFTDNFSNISSFEISVGVRVNFGPKRNVPVSLVRINDNLLEIHKKSLDWLDEVGARWAVKNPYVGDQYKPHIRHRELAKVSEGEDIKLRSIYLISANRQEDNIREVAAKVNLS